MVSHHPLAAARSTGTSGRLSDVQFEEYVLASRQRLFRFAVVLSGDTVLAGTAPNPTTATRTPTGTPC